MLRTTFAAAVFSVALFAQTGAPGAGKTFSPIPGLDKSLMDTSANPCADFYQYACGNWSKLHPIPSDAPYSDQFYNLDQYNRQVLRDILTKAAKPEPARDGNTQKIGDYYASCMDEGAIQSKGLTALQPEIDRINALKSKDQLPELLAHYALINVDAFFGFGSQQDFQDATQTVAVAGQGGIGLPEKDYYFRSGAKDEEIRKQYVQHVTNMLKLLGEPDAQAAADAQAEMKLETALAKVSLDVTSQRDPHNIYHRMAKKDLQALVPAFNWDRFYSSAGGPSFTELNVAEPDFFKGLNEIIQQTDLAAIQAYLRARLLDSIPGSVLPKAFDEEKFDFYARKLSGTPEQEVRWKRCVRSTDGAIPEALGKAYVQEQFPASSKERAVQIIHDIEAAMDRDIGSLDWMSPETKARAREKLRLIANKVGYPDKWRDYSKLRIVRGDAYGNVMRATEFESLRQLAKIGKPVDRSEWLTSTTPA